MAKTYTLTGTITTGQRSWSSGYWSGYFHVADSYAGRVGRDGENYPYWASNILFDAATLATLRTKTVTSITLTVTIKSGRLYTGYLYPIGYKLTPYDGSDVTTSSDAKDPWCRSNADSTEASVDTLGYLRSNTGSTITCNNTVWSVDLTGSVVPKYGYVIGPIQSQTVYLTLASTATLTVVTNEVETYTVSYNKGDYGTGTNTTDTKTQDVALTLKNAIFSRTGYTQTGWSRNANGSTLDYGLGASYTANAAITLYPCWTIDTYSVSYNKGTYGTGTNVSDTKTYGTDLTLRGAIFSRTGYTQTGWATSDGGSKVYDLGGTYSGNAAITLYPYWTRNTYTIQYKKGIDGTGEETTQSKIYGISITLLGAIFAREGYTQTGWSTTEGGAKVYDLEATYTANASTVLYPYWTLNTYSISYRKGSYGVGDNVTDTKTYNVAINLRGAIFTREGYTQTGWSRSDLGVRAFNLGAEYTANAAATLYPYWTIITYRVSYDANGGSGAPSSVQIKSYNVDLTLSSEVPTRDGYTFLGWATSSTATTAEYQPSGIYSANESTTLYAVWQENDNGGSLRYMQADGTLKEAPLYYMTQNGLVQVTLYVMQQNGTLKLLS